MTKEEFLENEKSLAPRRATILIVSAKLSPWLGSSSIPEEALEGARERLATARRKGDIRDFRAHAFGSDLHLQINTLGKGLQQKEAHALALEAATAALERAARNGYYRARDGEDFFRSSARERIAGLNLRSLEFPFTERGAEPIVIAKLIHGAAGGFNRMLFDLFFHPDKGSHQRLDGSRFIALVENVGDLAAGKSARRLYAFGDRPKEEHLFLIYPFSREPLEFDRDQVGDWAELLSLIANPVEWAISAVYAVQGRFAFDGEKAAATRHEPVALVSVEPALAGVTVEDPVAVIRLQSGLPAVGEGHFNLGADFHFTVGGPGGGYHVGVMPVTLAQARRHALEEGTARLVAYTYQSYDNGRIPPDHDVVDLFAQDSVQTEWLQQEAREAIQWMIQHGEFQPYVTAEEAERRARAQAEALERYFEDIPAAERGEPDPLVARANEAAGGLALSDIKADAGGKVGHTSPNTLFEHVARASLAEAQELRLVEDFRVFGVGDDLHLLMYHRRGVDSNDIHLLAFRTFWRVVWVTEILGYKPYGLAQDLKIGPATQGKRVDDLAEPSERFLALLGEHLPEPERSAMEKIRSSFTAWRGGRAGVEIKKPFAGNVTGQGPGFAELPLEAAWQVGIFAADKAGPAAFNVPLFHAAERALSQPSFRARHGESLAFEIYDVHEHKRIFLDARAHRAEIGALLGATNLFNVKRIWSLAQPLAALPAVKSGVRSMLLAASTEKLALITGGEYVGKDDPVLLGVAELVRPIFEFMKRGFYMTQGDERGSHYMMLVPKPLSEAIATVRSRGLQVGLLASLGDGRITELHDVYAEPSYREVRQRIERINARFWRAQGSEFTPIGVGARDVEPAYPLMKVLNRITATDSRYARPIRSATQELYQAVASR